MIICEQDNTKCVEQKKGCDNLNAKEIGKRLIVLRGKKKREQVASDLGITYSALAMYENGNRIPRDVIKVKIAAYYNRTIDEIFFTQK